MCIAETLNHRFINQLIAVLRPLKVLAEKQKEVLATEPTSPEWRKFLALKHQLRATGVAVLSLSKTQHLVSREVSIRRLSGRDSKQILRTTQRLAARASGFIKFVNLVLRHVYREDGTGNDIDPLTAQLNIRVGGASHKSRPTSHRSRPSSFTRSDTRQTTYNESMSRLPSRQTDEPLTHNRHSGTHSPFDTLFARPKERMHLGSATPQRHHHPPPVGIHMSSRYAELEALAAHQADEEHIAQLVKLLESTSRDLIQACCDSIDHILNALTALQSQSMFKKAKGHEELREAGAKMISKMEVVLHEFDTIERLKVILPFASFFEPLREGVDEKLRPSVSLVGPCQRCILTFFSIVGFTGHSCISELIALRDIFAG